MKKLKTNWSIKKSDITRSLSRIKKNPRPALDLGTAPDGKLRQIGDIFISFEVFVCGQTLDLIGNIISTINSGGVKRKLSRRLSQNGVRPSVIRREIEEREVEGDTEADTMFYITLTIEVMIPYPRDNSISGVAQEDRPGGVTLVPGSQDSDVDSNTYSHMSSDSSGSRPVSSRRRGHYAIMRPGVPPPAPPTRHHPASTDSELTGSEESMTSDTSNSGAGSNNDSLLLCDSLKVTMMMMMIDDDNYDGDDAM